MEMSRHINITEDITQNVDVTQSDHVALTMGAFSIAGLVVVCFILSILHSVFS